MDPSNLVGISEIADLAKVTRQVVSNWRQRYDHFPRPVVWFYWVQAEIIAMATDLAEFIGAAIGFKLILGVSLLQGAVLPLTQGGGWRGWIDVTAVGFYLAGVVPLGVIALLELNVLGRGQDPHRKMLTHALMVGVFLVVAHVAMIFGMMDPSLGGYVPEAAASGHMGH